MARPDLTAEVRGIISLIDSTPDGYKVELIQLTTHGTTAAEKSPAQKASQ